MHKIILAGLLVAGAAIAQAPPVDIGLRCADDGGIVVFISTSAAVSGSFKIPPFFCKET